VAAYVVRLNAAQILGEMGVVARPAVPALIRALRTDERPEMRHLAAYSLGKIDRADPVVIAALTDALNDESLYVRSSAAMNLKKLEEAK
jgi:HEAT repeat protein